VVDKLGLYNDALLFIGEARLAALTEDNTARRALDDAYDVTVKYCLEQGFWNFAMRAIQLDHSASVTPTFGFTYAFAKPTDWIRTHSVSVAENMDPPLMQYVDEPNYWFANSDPLYIRYISNDTSYGMDLSLWPASYANYVATRLAARICKRVTGSDTGTQNLVGLEKRAKADAMSKDAMNEPPGFPPNGTWVRSRQSGMMSRSRWDGTTS
jgi:hypothetical protein